MNGITTAIRQWHAITANDKNSLGRVPPRAATDTQPRSGFLVRVTLAGSARWLGLADVDGRCIEGVFDMRSVILLDHFDAGAAILGDLVNVRAFHQPHTDVGVPKAVSGPAIAVAVEFQVRVHQEWC